MSRVIREQNAALRIRGENGGRTAVHQHFELFFRLAASLAFGLDLSQMLQRDLAAANHFTNKQSGAQKRRKNQNVAGQSRSREPFETVKDFGQERTERGN